MIYNRMLVAVSMALLISLSSAGPLRAVDLYVSSYSNNNVQKLDGTTASNASGWTNPSVTGAVGVGVDAAGYLYAVSQTNGTLRKYDSSGNRVNSFEVTGLSNPRGVAIDSSGNSYIANGTSGLVTVYDASGTQVNANLLGFAIGSPYGVALDSGNLYVAAQSTGIVYKVDKTTGASASGWTNIGGYDSPTGLAVSSSGKLIVSSYNGGYLTQFDASGTYVPWSNGQGPRFNGGAMPGPEGLAVEGDNLYVSMQNTVGKYSLTTALPVNGWTNPTINGADMIAVFVSVPEPSTYAMAAIATGVMAAIARRRKVRMA
jgi:streptogramin lyase